MIPEHTREKERPTEREEETEGNTKDREKEQVSETDIERERDKKSECDRKRLKRREVVNGQEKEIRNSYITIPCVLLISSLPKFSSGI